VRELRLDDGPVLQRRHHLQKKESRL
jgi:hypothetical protein